MLLPPPSLLPAVLLALLVLCVVPASRAQVQEEALKAAFIYNFASFTTWVSPDEPGSATLAICSFTDPALHESLLDLAGQQVRGRVVTVRALRDGHEIHHCDVLVVDQARILATPAPDTATGTGAPGTGDALAAVWWVRPGVLTIINGEDGLHPSPPACITLLREGGRVRFDVDSTVAASVGIEFSSRLLSLARRVW